MSDPRVAVIGLDCASPKLIFEQWRGELPNLSRLMDEGAWGPLRTCHPPITVPAWACMMSGNDPGQLGIYGFRNRKDHSYDAYSIANSTTITKDRVWDVLSRAGKQVILLGVPQTHPIRPVNGVVVSDFLTPSTQSDYTYPLELKTEIEQVANGYVLDVENFRTDDKKALLQRIYEKTDKHFQVAEHLLKTRPWDFFMMVEMGTDRIHHGFWSAMDPTHRKYVRGNPFEHAIRDYYRHLDARVGNVLKLLPEECAVFVVSDHGARAMRGGICLNEWLIEKGYLKLKRYPEASKRLEASDIDWSRTRVWGDGGYYGRVFLNVKGREPQGIVTPEEYESLRDQLKTELAAIPDHEGRPIPTSVHRPQELYKEVRGVPPDLFVYFGDLDWRSVGSVGLKTIHTFDNDTGPDEANHDWNGVVIAKGHPSIGRMNIDASEPTRIYDIAPTILDIFGLKPTSEGQGRSRWVSGAYLPEEEEAIRQRLEGLGYI